MTTFSSNALPNELKCFPTRQRPARDGAIAEFSRRIILEAVRTDVRTLLYTPPSNGGCFPTPSVGRPYFPRRDDDSIGTRPRPYFPPRDGGSGVTRPKPYFPPRDDCFGRPNVKPNPDVWSAGAERLPAIYRRPLPQRATLDDVRLPCDPVQKARALAELKALTPGAPVPERWLIAPPAHVVVVRPGTEASPCGNKGKAVVYVNQDNRVERVAVNGVVVTSAVQASLEGRFPMIGETISPEERARPSNRKIVYVDGDRKPDDVFKYVGKTFVYLDPKNKVTMMESSGLQYL